jgi:hypothetical protein
MLNDLREQSFKPPEQGLSAGVADAQPDDHRCRLAAVETLRESLVLGDNDGPMLEGVVPNHRVLGIAQADVGDMFRMMTMRRQKTRQGEAGGNWASTMKRMAYRATSTG